MVVDEEPQFGNTASPAAETAMMARIVRTEMAMEASRSFLFLGSSGLQDVCAKPTIMKMRIRIEKQRPTNHPTPSGVDPELRVLPNIL